MKTLIISDLDNTWIGDNVATIALQNKLLANRDRLSLVYATGRSFASVAQLMRDFWLVTGEEMLVPDYLITGVGSEIYHQGILDYAWASKISQDWNIEGIRAITRLYPQLIPQPDTELNPWKISFRLHPTANTNIIDKLKQDLVDKNLAANVIFSSGRDVDILPKLADKGKAAMYVREKLQISLDKTLVCGDSGNDLSLYQHSILGVIVQNAQPELLNWYYQHPNNNIYYAKSFYAWAILEAIAYFNLVDN